MSRLGRKYSNQIVLVLGVQGGDGGWWYVVVFWFLA